MNYTKDYFIEKFEAIPAENWTTGYMTDSAGRHCALGHCGMKVFDEPTEEAKALITLFGGEVSSECNCLDTDYDVVYSVNDTSGKKDWGDTPKERILNKLKSLT